MGFDFVEIVLTWEEAFGVSITDAEATVLRTPRMATNLLATKLGAIGDRRGTCLTLRAFHRLRRAFVIGAGFSRREINLTQGSAIYYLGGNPDLDGVPCKSFRGYQHCQASPGVLASSLPRQPWLMSFAGLSATHPSLSKPTTNLGHEQRSAL